MKIKSFFFCVLSLFGVLTAEEPTTPVSEPVRNSFGHFDIGVGPLPILLPTFTVGHRNQWGHHGFDISLTAETVVLITQVKVSQTYLYYFTPNLKSQLYFGAGIGTSALISNHGETVGLISPQFLIGKEYVNEAGGRRFFQAEIAFPSVGFDGNGYAGMGWLPLVVLSYGIGF